MFMHTRYHQRSLLNFLSSMQLPAKITLVTFDKYEFSKRHILSPPRIHNKCAEPLFKKFAVRVEECHSSITARDSFSSFT